MPNSRRNDPPKEDCQQLDIVTINEKISQVSDNIESFIEAQDKRFNQLEEGLDTRFAEMTKKLTDAISGKQQETRREGHDQKRREKSENVDEESDKEVGPADSEEETEGKEKDEGKKVNATTEEAAAENQGKEKVSEEVKGPSPTKDELYDAIRKLLEEAGLDRLDPVTWAGIPRQLGAQFKVDMSDRKEEAEQIIDDVINKMYVEAIDLEN